MTKSWTLFSVFVFALFFNCAARAEKNVIIANDAAIRIPDSWRDASDTKPDMAGFFESTITGAVFSIIKESPEEMEIYEMDEYTQVTLDQYKEITPSFQPSEPKAGEINGLVSSFCQGSAKIEHEGKSYDFKLLIMTIKGKTHFYTVSANIPEAVDPSTATKEALAVMKSFRERP